jgi:hypothetical protein
MKCIRLAGFLGGAGYMLLRFGFSFSPETSLLFVLAIISIVLITARLLIGNTDKRNSN